LHKIKLFDAKNGSHVTLVYKENVICFENWQTAENWQKLAKRGKHHKQW
jgi:hypothetical protein